MKEKAFNCLCFMEVKLLFLVILYLMVTPWKNQTYMTMAIRNSLYTDNLYIAI